MELSSLAYFYFQRFCRLLTIEPLLVYSKKSNVKIHPNILKLYICIRMHEIAAILSHFDIFEITSKIKNKKQIKNYLQEKW